MVEQIDHVLNCLPKIVTVFNATVKALRDLDVDPQVGEIGDDYLPLNYSCPLDSRRLRLYHRIESGDHFAVAQCRCGTEYRFYLGRETLSLEALTQTHRWSPNVCMPLFMNPLVSGMVAGKSSALYSLVLNEIQRQALDSRPVPLYVPPALSEAAPAGRPDSLLYHYFYGGTA